MYFYLVVNTENCILVSYKNKEIMKKFDFRRQLKGMSLEGLKSLESKHLDYMLNFIGYDDKESSRHSRYVGYIQDAIKKIENV